MVWPLSHRIVFVGIVLSFVVASWGRCHAGDWTQFRGSLGTGVAATQDKLPVEIGPDKHVLWRTELAPGHSSPVIVGNRIFATAVRDKKLFTVCLDRATGKQQWEAEAPYEKLEPIHRIGSHAQSSPCADSERIVSFFGSCGLHCYDHSGKLLWKRPMGPFVNDFGASSSPIIVGDKVILCQDHDVGSFLMAFDKQSGEPLWKTDRSEFPRNASSPVLWLNEGRPQIVVAATLRVVGYDLETGQEAWTVRGISRAVSCTPSVGDDGHLYIAGWAAGGDENEPIRVEPFDDVAALRDADKNGTLEEQELEKGAVLQRYSQVDRNKDGHVTKTEYEHFRGLLDEGKNLIISIKQGAKGDATETHLRWKHPKLVPFCSSPVYVAGLLFTIKDGGILQCLNANTGKPTKQQRLEASDDYYASPVAGDGKIYLLNEQGQLTVVTATDKCEVLHTAEFKEDVYSTPAILDGRIYVRTAKALYCFGETK